MERDQEYSIVVKQHFQHVHKIVGYHIMIGTKQDGIYESAKMIKGYPTKKQASDAFNGLVYRMKTLGIAVGR